MNRKIFICAADLTWDLSITRIIAPLPDGTVEISTGTPFSMTIVVPYSLEKLRESVRNGEFNTADLGSLHIGAGNAADTDIPNQNPDFPAFLFLVRDSKGNVELRNAQSLRGGDRAASKPCDDMAAFVGQNFGVEFAAGISNRRLACVNAGEDTAQNF